MSGLLTSRRRLLHYGLAAAGVGLLPRPVLAAPSWAPRERTLPRVGFMKQPPLLDYMDAFHEGMREHGWVDGENYVLEYRYIEQQKDLPA
ncbi:MAG TPA: hypothetical protein VM347_38925, partial [Nonomuraea sp.]|nr:hypothetical protein [Nonomuraea sp.]